MTREEYKKEYGKARRELRYAQEELDDLYYCTYDEFQPPFDETVFRLADAYRRLYRLQGRTGYRE